MFVKIKNEMKKSLLNIYENEIKMFTDSLKYPFTPLSISVEEKKKPNSMAELIEQKKNNQPFYKQSKKPWE